MKIVKVMGREIYDSRGVPTLECSLILENGMYVTASVPSGLSRGQHEAFELRDNDPNRLFGMGVQKAIENLELQIGPTLIGKEPNLIEMDLKMLEMDGTENKSRLGANTILAASIAIARAQAALENIQLYELIALFCGYESVALPFPLFNMINGGVHANNSLQVQEFMLMPVGTQNFRACLEVAVTVFHTLKHLLKENNRIVLLGDEGGFAGQFHDEQEALDFLVAAMESAALEKGVECAIALDVAASQFYNPTTQLYRWKDKDITAQELIAWYETLAAQYPIYSIEDGLSEHDWQGWASMTAQLGDKLQLVGDDLFCSTPSKIARGIEGNFANSALIKPNQVGTVTETLQAIKVCKENGWNTVVSHRSGETEDTFIVDLAVGTSAGQIKAGSCARGERIMKYNQLLRIEDMLALNLMDL